MAWLWSEFCSVRHLSYSSHLKHLNKGDREVEVGQVTANQGQGEHDTDWDDSAQVDSASHWDLLPRVQNSGESSETLGHDGRKSQMPCCEDNWVVEFGSVKNPLVEDDDAGGKGDPDTEDCQMILQHRGEDATHAM